MAWERRGHQRSYYYRVTRDRTGCLRKRYYGMGLAAQRAFEEDLQRQHDREQSRKARRVEEAHLRALDAQGQGLGKRVSLLASAVLTVNHWYRHQREWSWRRRRGRRETTLYVGIEEQKMTGDTASEERQDNISGVQEDLLRAIQGGQAGDKAALPIIRALLDAHPALWTAAATSLTTQVTGAWLQVLTRNDLVSQEILGRQLQHLKQGLGGAETTPLEQLLIETLCVHWLQLQDAQLRAAENQKRYGYVTTDQERRLIQANKLVESTVKTLTQVQKLLRPKAPVINIAQQQIVHMA